MHALSGLFIWKFISLEFQEKKCMHALPRPFLDMQMLPLNMPIIWCSDEIVSLEFQGNEGTV